LGVHSRWQRFQRFLASWGPVFVLGLIILGTLIGVFIQPPWYLLGLFGFVIILNLAVFGVALATTRFVWYGMAVFLSVPLFGAVLGGARTYREPKLQPVALIRKSSDRAICGLYIAESGDRFYIG